MKYVLALVLLVSCSAFGSVDCPRQYPNGNTLAFDDGTLHFQNGNTLRYSDGTFHYQNANTFRYADGTFHYQNGNTLRYPDGTFHYPNGNTARYPDGTLHDLNGNSVASGSILITDSFDSGRLHVSIRKASAGFKFSVPWAQTLMDVTVSEQGDVICEAPPVTNESDPTTIRVQGAAGSATVSIKAGHNANAVREALQSLLDSN